MTPAEHTRRLLSADKRLRDLAARLQWTNSPAAVECRSVAEIIDTVRESLGETQRGPATILDFFTRRRRPKLAAVDGEGVG